MFAHMWDDHYSLILIMGCLTHWWTHCMSFLCDEGLQSLFCSSCYWPLKRHSKTNLYGSIPLQLNITYSWWGLLEAMALISEVIEEERGIHPGQFAKSNLAFVGELSWAKVNIDQLKMPDMHHVVSAGFQTDSHSVPADFGIFFFFIHSLNIRRIICWLCPINKVKHRGKTCSFGSISPIALAVHQVKGWVNHQA